MLRVLTYHRVAEPGASPALHPGLVSATPAEFARQMRHVAQHYCVVTTEELLEALSHRRRLPQRAVLLTFDDAYTDFAEFAWPILRKHRLPVTLFVPTAYPSQPLKSFWWDRLYRAITYTSYGSVRVASLGMLPLDTHDARRRSLRKVQDLIKVLPHHVAMELLDDLCDRLKAPAELHASVLTWEQLRQLAREGVTLGAHTQTHPRLTRVPLERAREEIRGSQQDLLDNIGTTLPIFCYPDGAHNPEILRLLRAEGFRLGFATNAGHNDPRSFYALRVRRMNVTPRSVFPVFCARLLTAGGYVDQCRHHAESALRPATTIVIRRTVRVATPAPRPARPTGPPRIAYIMSRFPKLTETFVLNEIRALQALGVPTEIYPLLRGREAVSHPEALALARRAHYQPFLSAEILQAQGYFLTRHPVAYMKLLAGVLLGTLGSANFFFGALAIFPKVVRMAMDMRARGVTHIHAHFANHPAMAALMVHRLTGIPFSFTAHGSDLHKDRTMLPEKCRAAEFVVTVSEYNRELIVQTCGEDIRDKVRVIHCGITPEDFSAPLGAKNGGPMRIICVASFEEVKGHRYLVDACSLLRQRGIEFTCDLVGDGPLREAVEKQIAQLQLDEEVRVRGARTQKEVFRMLAKSDVAVLASIPTKSGKREGIPVALMEAMAGGLPVVASRLSGIPELVGDGRTGLLVPPGDVIGLANALHLLAARAALRAQMGRAGREKVASEFNQQRSAEQLAKLFVGGDVFLQSKEAALAATASSDVADGAADKVFPAVVTAAPPGQPSFVRVP